MKLPQASDATLVASGAEEGIRISDDFLANRYELFVFFFLGSP